MPLVGRPAPAVAEPVPGVLEGTLTFSYGGRTYEIKVGATVTDVTPEG